MPKKERPLPFDIEEWDELPEGELTDLWENGTGPSVEALHQESFLTIGVIEDPEGKGWWVAADGPGVPTVAKRFKTREIARAVARRISTSMGERDPRITMRRGAAGEFSEQLPKLRLSEVERRARQ